ncbi:transglutaminase TgpA family protein [Planctobacterium marinum]|uniref:Transglutaminase n=1 Tax=Planctobacterium marinum TaxID=1631968 RepID=A0AA48HXL1_9ALTE|nr:transglutaminase [Planctobacterium marinum]
MKRNANRAHLLLSLNLLFLCFSLFEPLMLWVSLLVITSVLIRIALYLEWHKHLPKVSTINLLALLAAIVLAYTGWQLGLLLSMVNLLVMSGALKLMMMRKVRDYFILVLVEIFIIGCGFIFNQGLGFALTYGLSLFIVFLSLGFHVSPGSSLRQQSKRLLGLLLQSIPICILFFLILPQIGPLWKMPSNKGAKTGISDTITPGDFARLSMSDELVFRASFQESIPEKSELYWRTLVYEAFDGKSWTISKLRRREKERMEVGNYNFTPRLSGDTLDYEVILEPSNQNWLSVLDIAKSSTEQTWLSHDYQLQSRFPVNTKFKYKVTSYPDNPLNQTSLYSDTSINLMLPKSGNSETQRWVAQLRQRYPQDQVFIQNVERFFLTEGFAYTLKPEPMPVNPIDSFLFDYQAGFCSHYASAYAYIMRLAGIPARVVGGYQGGEARQNNYLSVYQYDAHAWVEIYLEENGWVRKDPTALISPERISLGLESAVAHENSFLQDAPFSLTKLKGIEIFNRLRLLMADVDFMWSSWVLGFDQQRQFALFKLLVGKLSPMRIALLSLAVFFVICILLLIFNYRVWFPKIENQHLHYYNQVLKTLARHGLVRFANEGPDSFSERIKLEISEQCAEDFRHITKLFVFHEYAPRSQTNPNRLPELKLAARSFKRRYRFSIK